MENKFNSIFSQLLERKIPSNPNDSAFLDDIFTNFKDWFFTYDFVIFKQFHLYFSLMIFPLMIYIKLLLFCINGDK